MDRRVTQLAERQHGVVGRRQLFSRGLPRSHVDELLRSGRLVRVSRGVYRVAGAPLTATAEMVAATLRCGPGARIIGEPLLAEAGVRTASATATFVVLTRPGRVVTGVDWSWRSDRLRGVGTPARIGGVPSYTPAGNLVELSADLTDDRLAVLVDGVRWAGLLPRAVALARRLPSHTGAVRLLGSGLVDEGSPESEPERLLDPLMARLGGRSQVWVTPNRRADWFFADAGLVVEYLGAAGHGGPPARSRDLDRSAGLRALGLAVVSLTADDLRDLSSVERRLLDVLAALGDRPHAATPPTG